MIQPKRSQRGDVVSIQTADGFWTHRPSDDSHTPGNGDTLQTAIASGGLIVDLEQVDRWFLGDALEECQMNMDSNSMANAVSRTDIRLRAEVLEEAYERLRSLPYSALRDIADSAYRGSVVVRDGKKHRLQVRVQTTQPDSQDLQVTVKLPAGGRRQPELVGRFVKKSQE